MKKRIRMGTSIILAALLAMSIPSCAPSGGTGGAQDSSSEEPLQTGQKELSDTSLPFADGDVTLSLLTFDSWYAPASYADSLPVWEEMEKRTGVKIEFQVVPYADSEAVIQTRLASGSNLPDITAVPPWTTTAGVTQYAQEDVLLCLDPYLENGAMPSTEAFLKEYPNIAAQMQSTDGSYYAVANVIALVNPVIPRAIIVRDDWLKKAGFENVEDLVTVEDWEHICGPFGTETTTATAKQTKFRSSRKTWASFSPSPRDSDLTLHRMIKAISSTMTRTEPSPLLWRTTE